MRTIIHHHHSSQLSSSSQSSLSPHMTIVTIVTIIIEIMTIFKNHLRVGEVLQALLIIPNTRERMEKTGCLIFNCYDDNDDDDHGNEEDPAPSKQAWWTSPGLPKRGASKTWKALKLQSWYLSPNHQHHHQRHKITFNLSIIIYW